MRAGVALYRDVFELPPTDPAVSPRLLASLQRNGGTVLGAFDGDRLVGFAYGYLGKDVRTGEIYHYSQVVAVHPGWQGAGVGRAIKFAQRDNVLAIGVSRMRWSYDPLRAANAHFNLDVLGARGRWFVRDLFGVEDTGRDAGVGTDRLIVEWDLTEEPGGRAGEPRPATELGWGEQEADGDDRLLAVPRSWDDLLRGDRDGALGVRRSVTAALTELLDRGYEAVSCRLTGPETAVYRLTPANTVTTQAEV
ncbi:MAG: GNAT family N-acetyltransferase [Streptosporangiales bacterium]|nr:GNAT family N-acetyltransferase [Streptosporangiales bacterium]